MTTSMGAFRRIPARDKLREGQFWLPRWPQHAKKSGFKMAVFWLLDEYFVAG
jgi:hypothetical protein